MLELGGVHLDALELDSKILARGDVGANINGTETAALG